MNVYNNGYFAGTVGVGEGMIVDGGGFCVDNNKTLCDIFNFPDNIKFNFNYETFSVESNLFVLGGGFFSNSVVTNKDIEIGTDGLIGNNLSVGHDLYIGGTFATNELTLNTMKVEDTLLTSNITITGDFNVIGSHNIIDLDIKVTDQLIINNQGEGPAFKVTQSNDDVTHYTNKDVALFKNHEQDILKITNNGFIGINNSSPSCALDILGNVTTNSNINIGNNLHVNNDLFVELDSYISGNLSVTKDVRFSSNLYIDESINVHKHIFVDGELSVNNSIYFNSNVFLNDTLTVDNVIIQSKLSIEETVHVKDNVIIENKLSVNNDVIFSSNLSIHKSLYVDEKIFIGGDLSIDKNINVDGFINVSLDSRFENQLSAREIFQFSDQRMKTNIIDLQEYNAMNQILKLKVKEYDYFVNPDKNVRRIGLIAQEVNDVLENTVMTSSQFIPNLLIESISTSKNALKYNIETSDDIINKKINNGDELLIFDKKYNRIYREVVKIDENINTIYFNTDITANIQLFEIDKKYVICGKKVSDFHSIDYNQILCYLIKAFQELHSKISL